MKQKLYILTTDEFFNKVKQIFIKKKIKVDHFVIISLKKNLNIKDKKIIFIKNKITLKNFYKYLIYNNEKTLIISVFWNTLIPDKILKKGNYNLYNLHPSFLPYDKGKSPYLFNIINNNPTGVSIHRISKKIDSGEILFRKRIKTKPFINGFTLRNVLMNESINFLNKKIKFLVLGKMKKIKIKNKINKINYSKNIEDKTKIYLNKKYKAKELIDIIRSRSGFKKYGAYFFYKKKKYFIKVRIDEEKK